jgi:tetratricopeptide (TPR) repeat protein
MGDMDTIEQLIDVAQGLQDKGKIEEALQTFSKAFDMMIDNAGKYALEKNADVTDLAELRELAPVLFAYSKEYLKQNITASYILNAMGVLFAQMKDIANAQQKFIEAMEYIPDGQDFSDPADNLERLAEEIAALPDESEEE